MALTHPKTTSGKIYDPVFLFMLFAVIVAVGTSFVLRAAVTGFSPPSAHAAAAPDGAVSIDNHMHKVSQADDAEH